MVQFREKPKLLRFEAPRQGALVPDHYRDIDLGSVGATLFYKPEWIRSTLRTGTRAIEGVGDALPSYWGAQAEIVLRELGGFLWIQITAAIIFVRLNRCRLAERGNRALYSPLTWVR